METQDLAHKHFDGCFLHSWLNIYIVEDMLYFPEIIDYFIFKAVIVTYNLCKYTVCYLINLYYHSYQGCEIGI